MDDPGGWPSLADQIDVATSLYGEHGRRMVADWLAGQMARIAICARPAVIWSAVSASTAAMSRDLSSKWWRTASMTLRHWLIAWARNGRRSRRAIFGYGLGRGASPDLMCCSMSVSTRPVTVT